MTKTFESIRQLFGRVLGNTPAGQETAAPEYSTLGIGNPEAPATNGNGHASGFAVENSAPDIETQTADTQRLPQVSAEFFGGRNDVAPQPRVAHHEGDEFGDALLDLDVSGGKTFAGDDPFLDVLDETVPHDHVFVEAIPETMAREDSSAAAASVPAFEEKEHWPVGPEAVVDVAQPEPKAEESALASGVGPANLSDLSPEAIDAIAQRVVAQLSDKVVREIAWEVVPELSELLIKQKLGEK